MKKKVNKVELFQRAKEVGLSHREVLTGIEFYGLERTNEIICKAHEIGYFIEFKLVPLPEPPGEALVYRISEKPFK
jgi:hypothetical protein